MRTKSPHAGLAADVVNSGQFASRNAWSPPQSCVRQTLCEPWKIDPARDGFGSAMIGGEKFEPSGLDTIGPVATTHLVASPLWEVTSDARPQNVLKPRVSAQAFKPGC